MNNDTTLGHPVTTDDDDVSRLDSFATKDPAPTPVPSPTDAKDIGQWAEWYHTIGLRVGQDQPGTTHDIKGGGALRSLAAIREAWEPRPMVPRDWYHAPQGFYDTGTPNVALRLGRQRDPEVVVICLDADGVTAARYVAAVLKAQGVDKKTPCCVRGRGKPPYGGAKWLFRVEDLPKSARLMVPLATCKNEGHDGLELLSKGRKATVAPSVREGTTYEWIVPVPSDLSEIPMCPREFTELPRQTTEIGKGALTEEMVIRASGHGGKTVAEWRAYMLSTGTKKVGSCYVPTELRGTEDRQHSGFLSLRGESVRLYDSAASRMYYDGVYIRTTAPVAPTSAPDLETTHDILDGIEAEYDANKKKVRGQWSDALRGETNYQKMSLTEKQAYWGPLEARVKKKKDKRSKLAPETIKGAEAAVDLAATWLPTIRADWRSKGHAPSEKGCGFVMGLGCVTTHKAAGVWHGCGKPHCYYCRSLVVALKAAATLTTPLVGRTGQVIGAPLGRRNLLYLFTISIKALEAWQVSFRRFVGISSEELLKTDEIPTNPDEARAYAKFTTGSNVTILSTIPCIPEGVDVTILTDIAAPLAVLHLVLDTHTIEIDPITHTTKVWGKIGSSHNLHLDAQGVGETARASTWVAEVARVRSVQATAAAMVEARVLKVPEGETYADSTSVTSDQPIEDVAIRQWIWARANGSQEPFPLDETVTTVITDNETLDASLIAHLDGAEAVAAVAPVAAPTSTTETPDDFPEVATADLAFIGSTVPLSARVAVVWDLDLTPQRRLDLLLRLRDLEALRVPQLPATDLLFLIQGLKRAQDEAPGGNITHDDQK